MLYGSYEKDYCMEKNDSFIPGKSDRFFTVFWDFYENIRLRLTKEAKYDILTLVWVPGTKYKWKEFIQIMDEGGSCYICNIHTTTKMNHVSITCILSKKMPAMLFLLKKRLNM